MAQMDPNSFLHTQPIHFDNYYVQARPLAKTIYGNQYKQAQEKLQQSRKKQQLLSTKKAAQQNSLRGIDIAVVDENDKQPTSEAAAQRGVALEHNMSSKDTAGPLAIGGGLAAGSKSKFIRTEEGSPKTTGQNSGRVSTSLVHRQVLMEPGASQITLNRRDVNQAGLENAQQRLGTSGTLNDNVANDFCRQSQMTDKDTVERLPHVSPGSPEIIQQPSQIITEVQTLANKRARPAVKKQLASPRRDVNKNKAVVQTVQMEELFMNGISQVADSDDNLPSENPLNTERFVAKFKGKQPILRHGPNFLNRKKTLKTTPMGVTSQTFPSPPSGEKG